MKFTKYFKIKDKNIEFVDIDLKDDTQLFIDPFLVIEKMGEEFTSCISDCYGSLIDYIVKGDYKNAKEIIEEFHEYKYIHLGYGSKNINGKGLGKGYSKKLFESLKNNKYLEDIKELRELENITLAIEGVDKDRVSDVTAQIISLPLIDFTEKVCKKYKLPTKDAYIQIWDIPTKRWLEHECSLPYYNDEALILVPKKIVSKSLTVTKKNFYYKVIIPIEQDKAFKKGEYRIVAKGTAKERKEPPFKKVIEKRFKFTPAFVIRFLRANPEKLRELRHRLIIINKRKIQT